MKSDGDKSAQESEEMRVVRKKKKMSGTNVKDTTNIPSQCQGCSPCTIAHPHSPIITSCTVHTCHSSLYSYSNKDTSWTTTCVDLYLYAETWWQHWTCSSHGKLRPVREKEEEEPGIYLCSQLNHCPGKGSDQLPIGSSCINLVHTKAQESQGSSRGPWTHRNQTILFSGSMF